MGPAEIVSPNREFAGKCVSLPGENRVGYLKKSLRVPMNLRKITWARNREEIAWARGEIAGPEMPWPQGSAWAMRKSREFAIVI